MIKVNKNGKVDFKGTAMDLMADYATLTNAIIEGFTENGIPREEAVEMIAKAHEIGSKTKEDVHKEVQNAVSNILENILEHLKKDEDEEGRSDE